jgi:predicted PurR-regulated permease PerM
MTAMLASLLPHVQGTIGWIFVGVLALMTGAVGAFAVFLFVQQFRNPGRPVRRGP